MSSLVYGITFCFLSVFSFHDIHVSICDIKYNTETASIQISLRVFLDDLEESIKREYQEDLKILTKKESVIADSLINIYVHRHLKVMTDGKTHSMNFIGKELSEDFMGMWAYFEIPDIKEVKALQIKNSILIELFDDQQNIVTVKKNYDKLSHWLFDRNRKVESINL